VCVLVGLPVAALAGASVVMRTLDRSSAEEWRATYGAADEVVSVGAWSDTGRSGDPPTADALAAAVRAAVPEGAEVTAFTEGPDGVEDANGRLHQVTVSDRRLGDRVLDGNVVLTGGRAPRRSGEAALSRTLLDLVGADVGDRVELFLAGSVEVTGTVVDRSYYDHEVAVTHDVLAPHENGAAHAWVDLPEGAPGLGAVVRAADDGQALEETVELAGFDGYEASLITREYADAGERDQRLAGVYVLGGVALLVAAIVASAAFAVGARRQLRTLGVLSAAGASPDDLRRTVLLQGTVTGLVGASAGAALGVAAAAVAHPFLDDLASRAVPPLEARPLDLIAAVLLGTVSATVAAWLPARSAARLPTLAALAGRRPDARLPAVVPALGAVGVAAGVGALAVSLRLAHPPWGLSLAGAVSVLLGATAVAPLLVTLAEPLAGRLRRGARVAARGLARQRLRSASVVAAVMAPLGVTVLVACTTSSTEAERRADEQLWAADPYALPDDQAFLTYGGLDADDRENVLDEALAVLPDAGVTPVDVAVRRDGEGDTGGAVVQAVVDEPVPDGAGGSRQLVVVGSDALRGLGAADATVEAFLAGAVVVPARPTPGVEPPDGGPPTVSLATGTGATVEVPAVVDTTSPVYNGSLVALASAEAVEGWGLAARPYGAMLTVDGPITDGQRDALGRVGDAGDDEFLRAYLLQADTSIPMGPAQVLVGGAPEPSRTWVAIHVAAVAASLAFTLLVVAVALTLTAAESGDERRLLDAIGAPPSLRRSVSAWQALLLPAMAVVLGVPISLLVSYAVVNAEGTTGVRVPWATVAAVSLLLPLASGGITWLSSAVTNRGRHDLAGPALAD
jgi:putative ABC transport system permease protein